MVRHRHPVIEQLMTPGEVAREAGVDPRTVSQWHRRGKLTAVRTIGRHRRFRRAEVLAYLATRKDRTPMMLAVPAAIMIMFNIAAIHAVAVSLRPGAPRGRHRQGCPCGKPHPVPVQCLVPLPVRVRAADHVALLSKFLNPEAAEALAEIAGFGDAPDATPWQRLAETAEFAATTGGAQ